MTSSRSGFSLKDTVNFAETIELMMRQTLGVDADEQVDEEEEDMFLTLWNQYNCIENHNKYCLIYDFLNL